MIRQANKFDIPQIIEMLKEYRDAAPIEILRQADDQEYIERFLLNLIVGSGFILVDEKDDKLIGMLIAGIVPNLWNPKVSQCSEIAYWVKPEFRGSTAGYRLIKEYIKECDKLFKSGRIQMVTISKMVNSPDLKYQKFGFEKLEETWIK